MNNSKNKNELGTYVKYSNIAFQMIGAIVVFIWGGNSLDKYLKLQFPLFTLIGSLIGLGTSFYLLLKKLK